MVQPYPAVAAVAQRAAQGTAHRVECSSPLSGGCSVPRSSCSCGRGLAFCAPC